MQINVWKISSYNISYTCGTNKVLGDISGINDDCKNKPNEMRNDENEYKSIVCR